MNKLYGAGLDVDDMNYWKEFQISRESVYVGIPKNGNLRSGSSLDNDVNGLVGLS